MRAQMETLEVDGERNEVHVLQVKVRGGATLLVCTCGPGCVAEATVNPNDPNHYQVLPIEESGIMIDAHRSFITSVDDALALAAWIEDAAYWLASANGYEIIEEDADDEEYEGDDDEDSYDYVDDDDIMY